VYWGFGLISFLHTSLYSSFFNNKFFSRLYPLGDINLLTQIDFLILLLLISLWQSQQVHTSKNWLMVIAIIPQLAMVFFSFAVLRLSINGDF
jgi:hypothetical protein